VFLFLIHVKRFGAIMMPSVNPSIWAYQKRRRNEPISPLSSTGAIAWMKSGAHA